MITAAAPVKRLVAFIRGSSAVVISIRMDVDRDLSRITVLYTRRFGKARILRDAGGYLLATMRVLSEPELGHFRLRLGSADICSNPQEAKFEENEEDAACGLVRTRSRIRIRGGNGGTRHDARREDNIGGGDGLR